MREYLSSLLLRVRGLLRRRELDHDLAGEIAFHLEMKKERGGNPLPAFGNPVRVKEGLRDLWAFPAVESVWRDVRHSARSLRRSPGFALVAILSLAIGAGANTAMFSVVRTVMLKSLPVRDPGQLRVVLWTGNPRLPNESNTGYSTIHAGRRVRSSFPFFFYEAVRASVPAFSDVIGFANYQVTVFARGKSDNARARFVSGNFFDALGVAPLAGRVIEPQDDRPGAPAIAVATYSWWQKRFGLDPAIIGRTITVNRRPVVLAGVTPADFEGITTGMNDELFFPLAQARKLGQDNYIPEHPDFWWVQMIARLRPGVDDREAAAQLGVLMARLDASADTGKESKKREPWQPVLENGAGGVAALTRYYARTPLLLLSTVVVLILLIACANIANLMLARGAARRREIAVRLSIGASRKRLIRQLLTEAGLIAFFGAAAGLALAPSMVKFISSRALAGSPTPLDAHVDWSILAIAIVIAIATAVLFGTLPAIRATRVDLTPALKEGGATGSAVTRGTALNRSLIVGQVALSTLLLAGAGLFVRTLANMEALNPGFNPERLLTFTANSETSGYKDSSLINFYERISKKMAAIPGIQAVTFSSPGLILNVESDTTVMIPGFHAPDRRRPQSWLMIAGDNFFATMQIPLVLGRDLDRRDTENGPRVAVINETFARRYFAGVNPLGRIFYDGGHADPRWALRVVGICRDARYNNFRNDVPPTMYLPWRQQPDRLNYSVTFEIRSALPLNAITPAVTRAAAEVDPEVPITKVQAQTEAIQTSLGKERLFATLVGFFSLLATALVAIGIYGLLTYLANARTIEIGIRIALGARAGQVRWAVLRETLAMTLAGIILGCGAALLATRTVASLLYGVKARDPISFVAALLLMGGAALAASWIPAFHASRIDPIVALRSE